MTTTKPQKIRLALFSVGAGALLAIVLVVFTGLHFWKDRTKYHIVFDHSVYGLDQGADVFFNGVRVGHVKDVYIDHQDTAHVRVDIEVDSSTPIQADTRAILRFAGITGLKVIDLHEGKEQTPRLAANSRIEEGETLLDKLEERAEHLADQTTQVLESANRIIGQVEAVAVNLTALTDPSHLGALIEQTRATAANLAGASAALRGVVDDNRAGLKASIASIELAARRVADLTSRVDNGQLAAAVSDLRQASRTFKEIARDVKAKPSRLLFSNPAPDRNLP